MAKTIVPDPLKMDALPGEAGERRMIALEASWETSAIADWLIKWHENADLVAPELHVRGMLVRLQDLSSICMSALDDDDETKHLRKRLTGLQEEVPHD